MNKKHGAIAVAVAAFTFLVLFLGTKFYEVYALQNPLSQELAKYHINKMEYKQQEKIVILYPAYNSDIVAAVNDVTKKFGDVKVDIKDKPSDGIKKFYNEEMFYIMQYVDGKQYGLLRDYITEKAEAKGYTVKMFIDEDYIYIKISDSKTSLYKIFPRWKEGEV